MQVMLGGVLLLLTGCHYAAGGALDGLQGGDVRGVARDATGNAVAGAQVMVHQASKSTTTAGDGTFVLRNLPAGRHQLWLGRPGSAVGQVAHVALEVRLRNAQRSKEVLGEVTLQAPATLKGAVTLGGLGQDFSVIRVAAVPMDGAESDASPGGVFDVGVAAGTGEFLLRGLSPGAWAAAALVEHAVVASAVVTLGAGETVSLGVPLTLPATVPSGAQARGFFRANIVLPVEAQGGTSQLAQGLTLGVPRVSLTRAGDVHPVCGVQQLAAPQGAGEITFQWECEAGGPYEMRVTFDAADGILPLTINSVFVPNESVINLGNLYPTLDLDCDGCVGQDAGA